MASTSGDHSIALRAQPSATYVARACAHTHTHTLTHTHTHSHTHKHTTAPPQDISSRDSDTRKMAPTSAYSQADPAMAAGASLSMLHDDYLGMPATSGLTGG